MDELMKEIRSERLRQRFSQRKLAEAAGLAEQWVYELETGKHSPTLRTLRRITDVLGMDIVLMKKRG